MQENFLFLGGWLGPISKSCTDLKQINILGKSSQGFSFHIFENLEKLPYPNLLINILLNFRLLPKKKHPLSITITKDITVTEHGKINSLELK